MRRVTVDREGSNRSATVIALGLLLLSLGLLGLGRFIEFDNVSGCCGDEQVLPLGLLAAFSAVGSVAVAVRDRVARRALGTSLLVLALVLLAVKIADDGFRFIWGNDEGELVEFVIALAFVGLFLVTPRFVVREVSSDPSTHRLRMSPAARTLAYLCASVLVGLLAFAVGSARYRSTQCTRQVSDSGECDLAGMEGLVWAVVAVGIFVVLVGVAELTRQWLRRRRA